MKKFLDHRTALSLLFLATAIGLFSVAANAQTPSRTRPKPLATPPRVLTAAEIISQSADLDEPEPDPETGSIPVKPPPPGTGEPTERVRRPQANRSVSYDDKQKRLMMNLDILTRAEQRTESLRKQLFEMIEKENTVKSRLDQIDYDIRPEVIERALFAAGSMRPEEVREGRRKSLEAERLNLQSLLTEIQSTRENLNVNLGKAGIMVDRLRLKLERDIEETFLTDEEEN